MLDDEGMIADGDGSNVLQGTITEKLYYGNKTEFVLDVNGQEVIVVIETVGKEDGDPVNIRLPVEKCAVIAK